MSCKTGAREMNFTEWCEENKSKYGCLIGEWADKNEDTTDDVRGYIAKLRWWKCDKGHLYRRSIKGRRNSLECPICSGEYFKKHIFYGKKGKHRPGRKIVFGVNDLATVAPALASEWHPTKNGYLLPSMVGYGSKAYVWWKCSKGHEWEASVCNRYHGCGCPYCSGRCKSTARH